MSLLKPWLRAADEAEAVELEKRIKEKIAEIPELIDALTKERRQAFVAHRFHVPLSDFRGRSWRQAFLYTTLGTLIAAGGFATSLVDVAVHNPDNSKTIVAIIGLIVGVLAVINQVRQPGRRNVVYGQTWRGLRIEGWEYVLELGSYEKLPPEMAYHVFATRVLTAPKDAEEVAEPGTGERARDTVPLADDPALGKRGPDGLAVKAAQ
jgi:hypothetical protein